MQDRPVPSSGAAPVGISRGLTLLFAVAGGVAVGNLYWAQPLLDTIAEDLHARLGVASLLVTLTQVGYAVGVFLVVPLGDTLDRRRLVPAVMTASAVALVASALAPSFGVLLGLLALVGLTTVTGQLLTPLAGDLATDAERGRVVGTVASGLLTGILLSRTVSGLVADLLGWRAVYGLAAVVTLVLAAVLARALPDVPRGDRVPYARLLGSVFTTARRHRPVRVTLVLGATGFGVFTMFWTGLTLLLSAPPYSFSVTQIGLVGLAGLAGALAAQRAGALHDRGWSVPATGAAYVLALVALATAALGAHSLALVLVAVVLLDVAVQASNLLNQTRIFTAEPGARSRLNTAFVVSNFVGGAIGSALAGVLYAVGGWTAVMTAAGVLVVGNLVLWAARRGVLRPAGAWAP